LNKLNDNKLGECAERINNDYFITILCYDRIKIIIQTITV